MIALYSNTESNMNHPSDVLPGFTSRIYNVILGSLQLYRRWWKEICLGIFIRLLALVLVLYMASINPFFPDINDMLELHTRALENVFLGLNPYGREYALTALAINPRDLYYQNFLNYGPMSLIIHLPCMVYPYSFGVAPFPGYMDFQPSFMVLHGIFDFLIFDRMMRKKYRGAAIFMWVNPVIVTLNFVTQMSVVMFLLWMGYEKWKDPFWSVFWLAIGAITYQYIALLLLFAIAFHIRSYGKWISGILPAIVILGIFQVWASLEALLTNDPSRHMVLINDLLIIQFGRNYEPWPIHIQSWWSWTGSIPAVLFNVYWSLVNFLRLSQGLPMIEPQFWVTLGDPLQQYTGGVLRISTIFNGLALFVTFYFIVKLLSRSDYIRSLKYGLIAIGLFLLGSPAGIWHHNFIVLVPLFIYLVEIDAWSKIRTKPQLRSN